MNKIEQDILKNYEEKRELEKRAREWLVGKKIKIICPHFNGQPYGRSKPKLIGKVFTIEKYGVSVQRGEIIIHISDPWMGDSLRMNQIEVLGTNNQ